MANKIKNAEIDILPDEKEFNDYDMLQDTLASLKHINTEYGLLVTEASNKNLSDKIEKLAKEIGTLARDCFNLMFEYGWYELTEEDNSSIKEIYKDFSKKKNNF